ncbi:MAG: tRNA lysidine(34) synthetase TilS [Burkholderiales bacterium]|nr:tRNA lysidine(34) synthetase TilS [Burkholderiales bacterium]
MAQSVDAALRDFAPALPLGVALSGGADSTALLLACAEKWPGQVVALHVNHGLQAAAPVFEQHCREVCQGLGVELRVQNVNAQHARGESPEDAARQARYKAFDALALMECVQTAIKSIALAQHADDQVETILLALSRGAGLAGLSGMATHWVRSGPDFYRPLLGVTGADIRRWLAARGQTFVEDPTNTDVCFTRNRIRLNVVPALQAAFPHYRETFARSATHAAQAQQLLDEVAAQDCLTVYRTSVGLPEIKALQALSRARQANVLRYWLKSVWQVIPSTAQLNELQDQLTACTTRGHRIHIKVGTGFVRRMGEALTWYNS